MAKGLWCRLPHKQQHTPESGQVMYGLLLDVAQGEYVIQTQLGLIYRVYTCVCESQRRKTRSL